MKGLVYSYMRFSDPRQSAGHSSERQLAYAARWAEEHGLLLDDKLTLRDEGLSAYHQNHIKSGALGVFLAAVQAGRVPGGSVLVVEGLDRLSRAEPIQAQAQLAQIVNAGISVVTASDGKVYSRERLKANPMDLVYSLLVMIRAHEESDTKSKRVTASIRRQCEGWMAGTYRGLIRNGKAPLWVELVDTEWRLIEDRVKAVHAALDMYRRGLSATRIIKRMDELGLSLTGGGSQTLQVYRLIKQRALVGEKEITVDGTEFRLPGYYPAVLTPTEWAELQHVVSGRGRRHAKGPVPHILTGMGITVCGYCGRAAVGQNIGTRNRDEAGRIQDGHRRIMCTSNSHGEGCPVPGSASVAPFERALMSYCSDIMNIQALYADDRGEAPRNALAKARERLADINAKLERLTDAMLESTDGVPAVFAKRARELEAEQQACQAEIERTEHEVASNARKDTTGADAVWRKLTEGVEAQDPDIRLQTRQLIHDTFEQIVVYHHGVRPSEAAKGEKAMVLVPRGGIPRAITINAKGGWQHLDDMQRPPETPVA